MNPLLLPNTSAISYCVAKSPGEWVTGGSFVFDDVYLGFSHFDRDHGQDQPDDEPHAAEFVCHSILVEKIRGVLRRCWSDERRISEFAHAMAEAMAGDLGHQAGDLICIRPLDDQLYDEMEKLNYLIRCLEVDRIQQAREAIADLLEEIEESEDGHERAVLRRRLRKLLKLVGLLTGTSPIRADHPPPHDAPQVHAAGGRADDHIPLN